MKKHYALLTIILFLFIYQPPILNFNILHIISAFSWIYIIINGKLIKQLINQKKLAHIYFTLFILTIYIILIILINDNSIANSIHLIYWMIDIIPFSIAINTYFFKKQFCIFDILNILLIVGTIQGMLALLSFLLPNVQQYFINHLISYGYSDVYAMLSQFRMYGFASNLTFSTPIVQSFLTVISLYLAINKNWIYLLFAPLIFFSAIINARTSFVILLIGIILLIFMNRNVLRLKNIFRILIVIISAFFLIKFGMPLLEKNSQETYNWISSGFNEIVFFGESNYSTNGSYYNYISNPLRYELPSELGTIFGVGDRIMTSNKYDARSDVGFINDIWLGGILYSIAIYILFTKFLWEIFNSKDIDKSFSKFIAVFLLGSFIVCNIKGYVFNMNNFTNIFLILYTYMILCKQLRVSN